MELIGFGFLIGIVFSMVTIGAGVLYADWMDKRQHNNDNNMSDRLCGWDGHRCRYKRGNKLDNKEGQ